MFGQSSAKKHDDKYKVGNGPMGNPDFSNAVNELANNNNDGVHVGPAPSDPTPPQNDNGQGSPPPNWGHPGKPVHHSQPHHNQTFASQPPTQHDPSPPPPPRDDPPKPPQDNQFSSVPPQQDNQPVIPPRDHDNHHDNDQQASNDNLVEIKQKALAELSPLVGHLDQSPEEKFHTIMMMIQASDDQSLLGAAHDAASKIEDEKQRAQALLDVVNEVNYFASQQNQN